VAGALPLSLAGLLALAQLAVRGTLSVPNAAVLVLWAAGAAGMPAYAYYTAWERLVTTQRPFETKSRVLFLGAAGALFTGVPLAVLLSPLF
jgi:NADPH:quinone reductase-like Zn-dependent oxidoreductase